MTIGDVLAAVCALSLVVCSWIALLVAVTVLLPARVQDAAVRIESAPGRCAAVGAIILFTSVLLTLATMHALVGPLRLLPFAIWGLLIACGAVGSAGIVRIVADRTVDPGAPRIVQIARAATLYALAGLFPVCGWMIVTPLALIVSLGAAAPQPARRRRISPDSPPSDLATVQAG